MMETVPDILIRQMEYYSEQRNKALDAGNTDLEEKYWNLFLRSVQICSQKSARIVEESKRILEERAVEVGEIMKGLAEREYRRNKLRIIYSK